MAVIATGLFIHLTKGQHGTEGIETYAPFSDPVSGDQKCVRCGKAFDVEDARDEYNSEFGGDLDYDENYAGEVCADCAIPDSDGLINQGRAIFMMNGDEDYDDDFVRMYL
ncbi:hypothetical protein [Streptomyces vastus]|uniref:hypothetical protein n=1 Tax=Streptomyces vastus TaxID=285451 RepID=UPI0031DCF56C